MASRTFNVTLHDGVDPNRPQMASSRPLSDLRVRPMYSSDHLAVKSRANPQIKRQRTWLRSSNVPFPCAVLWVLCLEFSTIVGKRIHPACRSGVVLFWRHYLEGICCTVLGYIARASDNLCTKRRRL